jgi:excisionase family DNA binding protein
MREQPLSTLSLTRLLTRDEVADLLRVPPKTLATWAYKGEGPSFVRVGRWARYDPRDVAEWLKSRRA